MKGVTVTIEGQGPNMEGTRCRGENWRNLPRRCSVTLEHVVVTIQRRAVPIQSSSSPAGGTVLVPGWCLFMIELAFHPC